MENGTAPKPAGKGTPDAMTADTPASGHTQVASPGVLMLQGLATPFFSRLASRLTQTGHRVHRVYYCGADWLFRGADDGQVSHHAFTGKPDTLPAFYAALVAREEISTILLFGDCRPVHEPALKLAREKGLTLYAFDEGYIRPGWVTMEADGTNGRSRMPRTLAAIQALAQAAGNRRDNTSPVATDWTRRTWMDIAGHAGNIAYKWRFRHYRSHRPAPLHREAYGWARRLSSGVAYGRQNAATVAQYETTTEPFFLVPLQLNSDYQIRRYSPFPGMLAFIEKVIASFAADAPPDHRLFFKNHPLDNGLINYRAAIARLARDHGIAGRVDFAAGGNLDQIILNSRGVVLVNSTVGLATLRLGRPLKVLGTALYDIPGISDQQPLARFWQNPLAPQQSLADEFLTVVETYTQIRGDLFSKAGIELAAAEAAGVVAGQTPRLPTP